MEKFAVAFVLQEFVCFPEFLHERETFLRFFFDDGEYVVYA